MGADLYITALYEPSRTEWEPKFEAAGKRRDSLPKDSREYAEAQEQMSYCYEQMYSRGYFRDSYNDYDLLWKFKLSWWQDVIPLLDKQSRLSVSGSRHLLQLMKEREGVFEDSMRELSAPEEKYFREKHTRLTKFLKQAIALNEPIDCWL